MSWASLHPSPNPSPRILVADLARRRSDGRTRSSRLRKEPVLTEASRYTPTWRSVRQMAAHHWKGTRRRAERSTNFAGNSLPFGPKSAIFVMTSMPYVRALGAEPHG